MKSSTILEALLPVLAVGLVVLIAGAVLVPNFLRARSRGHITSCKSNLKNIGTAVEMYSEDNDGHYPRNLNQLVPNYLKFIPECSGAGENQYYMSVGTNIAYNIGADSFKDYFFLECAGRSHVDVSLPAFYPQYDALQGLIER